jgi:hypothetical protein
MLWGILFFIEKVIFCSIVRIRMGRLLIVFLVGVVSAQEGKSVFKIGLNEGRATITAIGVASINHQGIVFSSAPGISDSIRYKWTDFSAKGLMELQRVLPRERAFQQKRGIDKAGYLQLISDELKKIEPPPKPAALNPISAEPESAVVKIAQAIPVITTPADSVPKLKDPPATAPLILPKKHHKPKMETEPETVSAFQLIKTMDDSPLPNYRPSYGGVFSVISSPAGILLVLIVMGFSVYAGNEIARFRNRPKGLVCGISALFPVVGPAIFLLLPDLEAEHEGEASETSDPLLIEKSDNFEARETGVSGAAHNLQIIDNIDSNSPYLDHSSEETHFEPDPQDPPGSATCLSHHMSGDPAANITKLYQSPEHQFDYEFFNRFFRRFINAQPDNGQRLILRTHGLEYSVHYITELAPATLNIIYPAGDDWSEATIEYGNLEEVEIAGPGI